MSLRLGRAAVRRRLERPAIASTSTRCAGVPELDRFRERLWDIAQMINQINQKGNCLKNPPRGS
jgi:hypothetical protein